MTGKATALALSTASFTASLMLRVFWGPLVPFLVDAGIGEEVVGAVGSLYFAGYVAAQVVGGIAADRYSPRVPMGLGLALAGLLNALFPLIDTAWWSTLSASVGFFSGFVYGPSVKLLRVAYGGEVGLAMGIFGTAWAIPFGLAALLVPPLAEAGLDVPFYAVGAFTSAIGLADLALLRHGGGNAGLGMADLKRLLTERNILLVSLAGFFVLYANWAIVYWLYYHLDVNGTNAALAMAIFTAAGLAVMPLAGLAASRRDPIRLLRLDMVAYAAAGMLIAFLPVEPYSYPLAACLGLARFASTPLISTALTRLFDGRVLATATAIANTAWQLSGLASPYMTAVLMLEVGPSTALAVSLAMPLAALAPLTAIRDRQNF